MSICNDCINFHRNWGSIIAVKGGVQFISVDQVSNT